jgi:hypothetical protein
MQDICRAIDTALDLRFWHAGHAQSETGRYVKTQKMPPPMRRKAAFYPVAGLFAGKER